MEWADLIASPDQDDRQNDCCDAADLDYAQQHLMAEDAVD